MSHTLEILFTGIVYLLGSEQAGRVQAILPAVPAPTAPFGVIVPEHTAYLKVKASSLVDADTVPARMRFKKGGKAKGEEMIVYLLGKHATVDRISIKPTTATPEKLVICKKDECDVKKRLRYDEYVAHREEICPTCAGIDAAYTTSDLSSLVAARVQIDRGHLAAAANEHGEWSEWEFKPAQGAGEATRKQQLTEQVALDLKADSPFSIVIAHKEDGQDIELELKLKSGASVEIGNMPLEQIALTEHAHHEAVDHHFGLFYTMLKRPVPASPPVPHRPTPPRVLGPSDNCPPLADEKG